MGDKRKSLVHINSNVYGKQPTSDMLEYGEIAVNYNKDGGFISFKDSEQKVSRISDDKTMSALMEHKEVVPYKAVGNVEDLDSNKSSFKIELNQKVGARTPHSEEINSNSGFTIPMDGYVMDGSSPRFNNLQASGDTLLSNLMVDTNIVAKDIVVNGDSKFNNINISGDTVVNNLKVDGTFETPSSGDTSIKGDTIALSGNSITISGDSVTIYRSKEDVGNPLSSNTVDSAINEAYNRSKVSVEHNEETYEYSIIQDGEVRGVIKSNDDISPYKSGEGKNSAVLGKDGEQIAEGEYSVAEGVHTVASNAYEHAFGYYNASTHDEIDNGNSTLFSVGNGKDGARKNAFEIQRDGSIFIYIKDERVCLNEMLSALLDKFID